MQLKRCAQKKKQTIQDITLPGKIWPYKLYAQTWNKYTRTTWIAGKVIWFLTHWQWRKIGAWGGVVVKALRYWSGGPGIDSRWCHWEFFPWYPGLESCALRLTQPLKVSTRDFSWGKGGRCVWLTTYHPCSAEMSRKSGALTYSEPLGPPRHVVGDPYFFFFSEGKSWHHNPAQLIFIRVTDNGLRIPEEVASSCSLDTTATIEVLLLKVQETPASMAFLRRKPTSVTTDGKRNTYHSTAWIVGRIYQEVMWYELWQFEGGSLWYSSKGTVLQDFSMRDERSYEICDFNNGQQLTWRFEQLSVPVLPGRSIIGIRLYSLLLGCETQSRGAA